MKKWTMGVALLCATVLLSVGTKVNAEENVALNGRMHVQNIGWRDVRNQSGTLMIGTTGRSLHLEAFQINSPALKAELNRRGIHLEYVAHVANVGWQAKVKNAGVAGTTGRNLAIEAVRMVAIDNRTGRLSAKYDIYYRAHLQNIGWENHWSSNGNIAGTTGRSIPMEAIEVKLVKRPEIHGTLQLAQNNSKVTMTVRPSGDISEIKEVSVPTWAGVNGQNDIIWYKAQKQADGSYQTTIDLVNHKEQGLFNMHAYAITKDGKYIKLQEKTTNYRSQIDSKFVRIEGRMHVQNVGWRDVQNQSGTLMIGTTGRGLALEAFQINTPELQAELNRLGIHLEYIAHVGKVGWQSTVKNAGVAGTTGRGLPIEAVKIAVIDNRTGKASDKYDINYRAHLQNIGWENHWSSNGNIAGTTGRSIPMEAIEVKLVKRPEIHGTLQLTQNNSKVTMKVRPSGDISEIKEVSVPTWAEVNGQNDIVWYKAQKQADGSYQTTIDLVNHKEQGLFNMHAYAITKEGKYIKLQEKTMTYTSTKPSEPETQPTTPEKEPEKQPETKPEEPKLQQATFSLKSIDVPWSRTDRVIDESYLRQAFVNGTDEYGKPLSVDKLKITTPIANRTIKGGTDIPIRIEVAYQAKNGVVKRYMSVSVTAPVNTVEGVRKEMLKLVNELRASVGVQPVQYDESLNKASDVRVNELMTKFSHVRPNGEGSSTALRQFVSQDEYYENYIGMGENIQSNSMFGDDYTVAKRLFESWKNSPGHYQNMIMSEWNVFGFSMSDGFAQQFFSEKVSY